ncbi:MAG: hypothetical protein DCC56_06640 [Anaerolineae bacterium]|nr:MAG: hypothetical protein DCC56_06640 [Anaerolineae bacterium]WKZ43469.1 MAG: hypothetical protein QY302_15335 [Anaerolineales bacterium]
MFDNLRESASSSSFYEEEANELYREPESKPLVAPAKRRGAPRFLGMTAQQRFLLSLMLLFTVCALGTLAMFLLGKMSLF